MGCDSACLVILISEIGLEDCFHKQSPGGLGDMGGGCCHLRLPEWILGEPSFIESGSKELALLVRFASEEEPMARN